MMMMMMVVVKLSAPDESLAKTFCTNDFLQLPVTFMHIFPCDAADYALRRKHHYNISGILNGLQVGYDKRVRPNYGGEFCCFFLQKFKFSFFRFCLPFTGMCARGCHVSYYCRENGV